MCAGRSRGALSVVRHALIPSHYAERGKGWGVAKRLRQPAAAPGGGFDGFTWFLT